MNCTYFKRDSSCLDNEIIDRHFDFFWKEKEWTSDFCNAYIRPADLDPSDQDLDDSVLSGAAASVSSRPLMQYQTVMNAAIGIIHDLTVKSFRPRTMRVRKNNRGERIPRYTHHLSNGSGMAAPFPPSQRRDWRDLPFVWKLGELS